MVVGQKGSQSQVNLPSFSFPPPSFFEGVLFSFRKRPHFRTLRLTPGFDKPSRAVLRPSSKFPSFTRANFGRRRAPVRSRRVGRVGVYKRVGCFRPWLVRRWRLSLSVFVPRATPSRGGEGRWLHSPLPPQHFWWWWWRPPSPPPPPPPLPASPASLTAIPIHPPLDSKRGEG